MEKIIQEIINNEPFLRKKAKGIPFLGKRQLNGQFSEKISIVNDAIDFCSRKFLIGSSLGYFIDDKLIGRITFALFPKELVESFVAIKEAIQKLQ